MRGSQPEVWLVVAAVFIKQGNAFTCPVMVAPAQFSSATSNIRSTSSLRMKATSPLHLTSNMPPHTESRQPAAESKPPVVISPPPDKVVTPMADGELQTWVPRFTEDKEAKFSAELSRHPVFADDDRPVVLYDGTCSFCDAGIWLMIDYDGAKNQVLGSYRFATQESQLGTELLTLADEELAQGLDSIAVADPRGLLYADSAACLVIARLMKQPFPLLAAIMCNLPRTWRDNLYHWISANRHIFGEKDGCRIPEDEQFERFLTEM